MVAQPQFDSLLRSSKTYTAAGALSAGTAIATEWRAIFTLERHLQKSLGRLCLGSIAIPKSIFEPKLLAAAAELAN